MKTEMQEIDQESEVAVKLTPKERGDLLNKIGALASKDRFDAVAGRKASGIETIWREDEAFCEGEDEHNAGANPDSKTPIPGNSSLKPVGSTVFLNITGPYCEIAAARMGDMLQPTSDPAFSITSTPVPDLVKFSKGEVPDDVINAAAQHQGVSNEEAAHSVRDEAERQVSEAKEKASRAQEKIADWMTQGQYQAEVRAVLSDTAKVGCGVIKGPIPEERKSVAYIDGELVVSSVIEPCSKRVDYWNCYPDQGCGESIHNGSFFFECDEITRKSLMDLRGSGLYFDDQIAVVLNQGPMDISGKYDSSDDRNIRGLTEAKSKSTYKIWYKYTTLMRDDVEGLGLELDDNEDCINVKITMVNNVVIQLSRNHLDTGEFPYDFMRWKERKGSPFGIGVSRLVRTSQRIINSATRAMMDNAGIASGPMWAINQGVLDPINGVYEIAPLKGWKVSEDATEEDVSRAFAFFNVEMRQGELQNIVNFGMSFAEQATGIPLILQGHAGSSPDTVGGMRMLQNNASTTLRRIAKIFDDLVTEPHVRRYYAYLLQYGPDDTKGDFQIDAKGSAALVERDMSNEAIMGMAQIATNPMFGIDPKKWAKEQLASQRLDYDKFKYDDQEWEQIVAQMSQPAADPRVEIEQLKAQNAQQEMQFKAQQAEKDMEFQALQADRDQEYKLFFQKIEHDNKNLIESGKQELTAAQIDARYKEHLERIDSEEAQTVFKAKLQAELSGASSDAPQVLTPPTEPAGRAPDGQAYQL